MCAILASAYLRWASTKLILIFVFVHSHFVWTDKRFHLKPTLNIEGQMSYAILISEMPVKRWLWKIQMNEAMLRIILANKYGLQRWSGTKKRGSKTISARTFPSSILTQARMDFQVAQTSSIKSPCVLQAYLVHLMYVVHLYRMSSLMLASNR